MKKLLIASLVLTSLPALAIDWTEKNEREIYDLMYLPKAGTIFGQTFYSSTAYKSTAKTTVKIAELEVSTVSLTQFAGYSVMDNLAVVLEVDYLLNSTQKLDYTSIVATPDSESESKGLGDPTLQVKYRVLDQKDSKFNLDITPKYTFSTGDSETGTEDDDGNGKQGGSNFGLDVTIGKKYAEAQWTAFIGYEQSGEANSKDATTKEKSKTSSYGTLIMGGGFQRHMTEKWIFEIEVLLASVGNYKEKTGTEYIKFKDQSSFSLQPSFTYVSNADLAFSLGLDLTSYADYKTEDEAGTKVKYEENAAASLILGAKYQF